MKHLLALQLIVLILVFACITTLKHHRSHIKRSNHNEHEYKRKVKSGSHCQQKNAQCTHDGQCCQGMSCKDRKCK
jgi:hypothetical protein